MAKVIDIRAKIKSEKDDLKKRMEAFFKKDLPKNWIQLFIYDNPQYAGQENYFTNLKAGRINPQSMVLRELEAWELNNRRKLKLLCNKAV